MNLKMDAKIQVRYIIFLVVLCGHETWALTRSEKHVPTVSGNRMMRNKFGPKMGNNRRLQDVTQRGAVLFVSLPNMKPRTVR